MITNANKHLDSIAPLTFTVALAFIIFSSAVSVNASEKPHFCQNAGAKNSYNCDQSQPSKTQQGSIEDRLNKLNRWMADEEQALSAPLVTTTRPASDQLRQKIAFNAKLLATELQQAKKRQRQGDLKGAFDQFNHYLVANPSDPNGWLFYGISLINQNKLDDAADIFRQLTLLYPDAPEPYNNLAVIYARQGNHEKAVELLQQALETNPSYAQVQKNLQAIYSALATQAYNRALDLSHEKPPQANLAVLDQVYQSGSPTQQQSTDSASAKGDSVPSLTLIIEERNPTDGITPNLRATQ